MFFLGWSMAIISGVAYTHFPDTSQILEISLQILFYITPILYKPNEFATRSGKLAFLVEWNPFTSVLALIRTPILEGTIPATRHIAISFLFLAVLATVAVVLLRKLERTLVFWI